VPARSQAATLLAAPIGLSTCANMSKMRGQRLSRMPHSQLSRTDTTTCRALPLGTEPDAPASGVVMGFVLALFVSRLLNTWASRVRSASRKMLPGAVKTINLACWLASMAGRAVSTALTHHVRQEQPASGAAPSCCD